MNKLEQLKQVRESIKKQIIKKDFFIEEARSFRIDNFHNECKKTKQKLINTSNMSIARNCVKKLNPKFIKFLDFLSMYKNEISDITVFYDIVEEYYHENKKLIHYLLHKNKKIHFVSYEDAIQEAYVAFLKTMCLYDRGTIGALLGCNINFALHDMLRQKKKTEKQHHISYSDLSNTISMSHTVSKYPFQKDFLNYYMKKYSSLKQIHFNIIKDIFFDNYTAKEVAKKYKVSISIINHNKKQIKNTLRQDSELKKLLTNKE